MAEHEGFVEEKVHGAQRKGAGVLLQLTSNALYTASLFTAGNEFPRGQLLPSALNSVRHMNGDFMQPALHGITLQNFVGPLVLFGMGVIGEGIRWRTTGKLRRG